MSRSEEPAGHYNVSDLVARQVDRGRADARAIVAEDATLTYEELRRQLNRAGNLLTELGVKREQRVLLVLDDTSVFPIVFLGAMRIGAIPIPVSPLDKDENLKHYVTDSCADLVVTDAQLHERLLRVLADQRIKYLVRGGEGKAVIEFDNAIAQQSDDLGAARTHRDDIAFWLYSSGSTGRPKGVVHLQHDIEVTCENFAGRALGLTEEDITFSTSKLFHAYGLGNGLSFPLWFGATSILMKGPPRPDAIVATVRRHKPTVFFSVPALYSALLLDSSADGAFESVRFCVSAAEALPISTLKRWRARFGSDILDGMGSTEMLNTYCSNRPGQIAPGTAGWPVPGYELRLVDEDGKVLEGPAIGALQVRGDSCAAYYWHQHEKTKASILGDWFVTGDRCERHADGSYTYVGRADDMLKVGGLWVSPLEIEHVLRKHPRVEDVGVVGVRLTDATRVLAYVKPADGPGDEALADELRAWCEGRLASHEHPHFMTFVDELPSTPNGKVQRFRLGEWAAGASNQGGEFVYALARTWSSFSEDRSQHKMTFLPSEVTRSPHLNSSLRSRKSWGSTLRMGDLLAAPTVERLAGLLRRKRTGSDDVPARVTVGRTDSPCLYIVPAVGYSVLQLRPLADALAEEIAIYGVSAWKRVPASSTVREEANRLTAGLQTIQASGPYWLAGYSSGGVTALEMTRLLEEAGERVAGLLILDTQLGSKYPVPPVPRPTVPKLTGVPMKQRVALYARALRKPRLALQSIYTSVGLAALVDEVTWKADLQRRGTVRPSRRDSYYWTMETRAMEQYSPGTCRAPVTLIRCPDTADDPIEGTWKAIAQGGLTIRYVDVQHDSLLDVEHAETVARAVRNSCPWTAGEAAWGRRWQQAE